LALGLSKQHLDYSAMVALLQERGMHVADTQIAKAQLVQFGYYRLSGFWYPARTFSQDSAGLGVLCHISGKPKRSEIFQPGTTLDDAVALYNFDKSLRLLMLDAVETIEVHLRTVLAHELGKTDPMAYTKTTFIDPKFLTVRTGYKDSKWSQWLSRQQSKLDKSSEECIEWHRLSQRAIPYWVAVEAWDFGTLSTHFQILKRKPQSWVLARLNLSDAKIFAGWLREINTLRNRSAHHTRIWNQKSVNPLDALSAEPYFQTLSLSRTARERLYGMISVLWFLLLRVDPASRWIHEVADLLDAKPVMPGCTYAAMGFADEAGFPRELFGI
jgi:abortive infection bacteriophage resistance protein